jgi:iron complex outermembrane recepter protein
MRSRCLLIGVGFMALSGAAGAADADTPASGGPPQDAKDQGLQEVVVTAERRKESAQRAALPIQAISAEDLQRAGVTRPEDLTAIATGVNVSTGGNVPQIYIRGVGNYATNIYSESAVAMNVDGVYVSRPWAMRGEFFDLDRVEVLKGPQGTLYGRNATGGALNLISASPLLGQTSGYVEAEGGDYKLARGAAAVNIPLGQDFAVRIAGQAISRDGYLADGYDDEKNEAARVQALYVPSSDLSVILRFSYQHNHGRGAGTTPTTNYGNNPWIGAGGLPVLDITRAEPFIGPLLTTSTDDGFLDSHVYALSSDFKWNLGPATLTIIPAYRYATNENRYYVSSYQISETEYDHQTSVEARLSGESERIKWVAGTFYFDEEQGNLDSDYQNFANAGISGQVVPSFNAATSSYAGFGQTTFSVVDRFRLTAGGRYTYERKTQSGLVQSIQGLSSYAPPACPPGYSGPQATLIPDAPCLFNVPLTGLLTYNSWTYKGGMEYDVAPNSMFYANVSTGFKSGGFFTAPQPNSFKPERITAYEVGLKNRFLDNRLQVNVEAFDWLYHDHQESYLGSASTNPYDITFITENAGRAESRGADLDVAYLPTHADRLSLGLQYDKSSYGRFTYTYPSAHLGPPTVGCRVEGPVTGVQTIDCAGLQMVRTPTWWANASYDHTFALPNGSTITAGARAQSSSGYYLSIDFLPNEYQRSYTTVDADLAYTAPSGNWSVTAWGRNLGNKAVLTEAYRSPYINTPLLPPDPLAGPYGLAQGTIRPPRTFGVRVHVDF